MIRQEGINVTVILESPGLDVFLRRHTILLPKKKLGQVVRLGHKSELNPKYLRFVSIRCVSRDAVRDLSPQT